MKKPTTVVLFVVAGLVVLCCGGLLVTGVPAMQTAMKIVTAATEYGNETVTAVASEWNADELIKRSGGALKAKPKGEVEALVKAWREEYGAFKSGTGTVSGVEAKTGTGSAPLMEVRYTNSAVFEKGKAQVELTLVQTGREGPWVVESFEVVKGSG